MSEDKSPNTSSFLFGWFVEASLGIDVFMACVHAVLSDNCSPCQPPIQAVSRW